MGWLEKLLDSVHRLYHGFLLRDVLGYVFPGSLVIAVAVLSSRGTAVVTSLRTTSLFADFLMLPNSRLMIALGSVGAAYLIGLSIFGIGIVLGLLRYYPHGVSRWLFHLQSVQFTSNTAVKDFSTQRERMVVLLHATGTFAIAILICSILIIRNSYYQEAFYPLVLLGIAALARHWETVYNLRSLQEAILVSVGAQVPQDKPPPAEDPFGRFLGNGGLIGLILSGIGRSIKKIGGR